ncbi:MAG: hypothetical protein ACXQTS_01640 [Candidatus Methanospirareceae archaeon]
MLIKVYKIWSAADIEVARWIRANTEGDSVFLTANTHNHPIPALSGRQVVIGFEGWLWSHGLSWDEIVKVKEDMRRMYSGNYTLLKEYGVDYVCIGPYERNLAENEHFSINYSAFSDEMRFHLRYDKVIGGERWRIYEVVASPSPTIQQSSVAPPLLFAMDRPHL